MFECSNSVVCLQCFYVYLVVAFCVMCKNCFALAQGTSGKQVLSYLQNANQQATNLSRIHSGLRMYHQ